MPPHDLLQSCLILVQLWRRDRYRRWGLPLRRPLCQRFTATLWAWALILEAWQVVLASRPPGENLPLYCCHYSPACNDLFESLLSCLHVTISGKLGGLDHFLTSL